MKQGFTSHHWNDREGRPAGGCTTGNGFTISWQNGPLGRGDERREPNGAFVEDIIASAKDRLAFYQNSPFRCDENALAIAHLDDALRMLKSRTMDRQCRGVEGTHEP